MISSQPVLPPARSSRLLRARLTALDQDLGTCRDFLFDDRWWTICHMLVDTGGWLISQKVLVSPVMIDKLDWKTGW